MGVFKVGKGFIINAPAVVKVKDLNAGVGADFEDYTTVGELGKGGAKVKITPEVVKTKVESGSSVIRTSGYDCEISFDLPNVHSENLAVLDALSNIDVDVIIEQTVKGFANPRTFEFLESAMIAEIDTALTGGEASKIPCKVEKSGLSLADIVTLIDPSNP